MVRWGGRWAGAGKQMAKREVSFGVAGSHRGPLASLLPAGPGRPLQSQDPDAHVGHGPLGPLTQ